MSLLTDLFWLLNDWILFARLISYQSGKVPAIWLLFAMDKETDLSAVYNQQNTAPTVVSSILVANSYVQDSAQSAKNTQNIKSSNIIIIPETDLAQYCCRKSYHTTCTRYSNGILSR